MTDTADQTILDILALPARDFISHSHWLLFGASPTHEAKITYERRLLCGEDRLSMLVQIYNAANKQWQALLQAASNEEFVEALYKRYLHRSADTEGLQFYLEKLQKKERRSVQADIATSPEAKKVYTFLNEIERLVAADQDDGRWWRRFSRTQRRKNLQREITLQAIASANHHTLSMVKDEMRIAVEQVRAAAYHQSVVPQLEPTELKQAIFMNLEEVRFGQMGRRTLSRLRAQTATSSRGQV